MTKEQKLLIAQKLRELPDNYRDVVLAHYLEEKSYQEIALQENIEVKTVEMKLYRARKWIKNIGRRKSFYDALFKRRLAQLYIKCYRKQ